MSEASNAEDSDVDIEPSTLLPSTTTRKRIPPIKLKSYQTTTEKFPVPDELKKTLGLGGVKRLNGGNAGPTQNKQQKIEIQNNVKSNAEKPKVKTNTVILNVIPPESDVEAQVAKNGNVDDAATDFEDELKIDDFEASGDKTIEQIDESQIEDVVVVPRAEWYQMKSVSVVKWQNN